MNENTEQKPNTESKEEKRPSRGYPGDRISDAWVPANCPQCGGHLASLTILGPTEQRVSPCGCNLHGITIEEH